MIGDRKQNQSSGDNSSNYQAENIIITQPDEASIRSIVEHQLKDRLSILTKEAFDIYKERCTDFTDGLILLLSKMHSTNAERLKEPSVQFSINSAHRAYGESGDENLKETLITIIGKMCTTENNNLDRFYKDSIDIISKLSRRQLNLITLVCAIKHISNNGVTDLNSYVSWLRSLTEIFLDDLPTKNIEIQYLDYLSLGKYDLMDHSIYLAISEKAGGIFQKGFNNDQIEIIPASERPGHDNFIPCLNAPGKIQVAFLNEIVLQEMTKDRGVGELATQHLKRLYKDGMMDQSQMFDLITAHYPAFKDLVKFFDDFQLNRFSVGTIGQTISQINIEARTGMKIDITNWA